MKYLLLILTIIFVTSCSSTHKIKQTTIKTIDSTVVSVKDTSDIKKEQTQSDNLVAKGVDITFDYGNNQQQPNTDSTTKKIGSNTVSWKPFYYNPTRPGTDPISKLITQTASASGLNGRIPTSIRIHFDSLGSTSVSTIKSDSIKSKSTNSSNVKSKEKDTLKNKTSSGLSFGGYATIAIAVIIILVLLGLKFKII